MFFQLMIPFIFTQEGYKVQRIARSNEAFLPESGLVLNVGIIPSNIQRAEFMNNNLVAFCKGYHKGKKEKFLQKDLKEHSNHSLSCEKPFLEAFSLLVPGDLRYAFAGGGTDRCFPFSVLRSAGHDDEGIFVFSQHPGIPYDNNVRNEVSYEAVGVFVRETGGVTPETMRSAFQKMSVNLEGLIAEAGKADVSDKIYISTSIPKKCVELSTSGMMTAMMGEMVHALAIKLQDFIGGYVSSIELYERENIKDTDTFWLPDDYSNSHVAVVSLKDKQEQKEAPKKRLFGVFRAAAVEKVQGTPVLQTPGTDILGLRQLGDGKTVR